MELFLGEGMGSDYLSAYRTAYGLLQAVSEFMNHRGRLVGGSAGVLGSVLNGYRGRQIVQFQQQMVRCYTATLATPKPKRWV